MCVCGVITMCRTTNEKAVIDKVAVVIAAAGSGTRMGLDQNKIFAEIAGVPVLIRSVEAFEGLEFVEGIYLVAREDEKKSLASLVVQSELKKVKGIISGGETRQESVYNGLMALPKDTQWVFIHDAARPLVSRQILEDCFENLLRFGAVGVGVPVKDTIKVVKDGFIISTPDRSTLWAIQTPQAFSYSTILQAHQQARTQKQQYTDDCSLLEAFGHKVKMIAGSYQNIKITTPEDLILAESFLLGGEKQVRQLVGFGYDVHRLVPERKLILCGLEIDYDRGLAGHSDADVAVHALMDALLGAAGLGDIGQHFPDTDQKFKDISSMVLLERVVELLKIGKYQIINVDLTIVAEKPRLAPFIPEMKENLAKTLKIPMENINIKATTSEKLGFTGRGEGIASYAVANIRSQLPQHF